MQIPPSRIRTDVFANRTSIFVATALSEGLRRAYVEAFLAVVFWFDLGHLAVVRVRFVCENRCGIAPCGHHVRIRVQREIGVSLIEEKKFSCLSVFSVLRSRS